MAKKNISIELIEGRNYFVRYWKVGIFGKRKELSQFHGKLIEINLDRRGLIFKTDEYYGDGYVDLVSENVLTIVEIKSKGKRLLELNSKVAQ